MGIPFPSRSKGADFGTWGKERLLYDYEYMASCRYSLVLFTRLAFVRILDGGSQCTGLIPVASKSCIPLLDVMYPGQSSEPLRTQSRGHQHGVNS